MTRYSGHNEKKDVKIDVCRPSDCLASDLCTFADLVKQGGKVEPGGLEGRIRKAYKLAFCRISGEIVSIAAIKKPNKDYKKKIFRDASADQDPDVFTLEYGWAFTKAGHGGQGYAFSIASVLLREIDSPIFATTQSHNDRMKSILEEHGFARVGSPYQGCEGSLVLYIKTDRTGR